MKLNQALNPIHSFMAGTVASVVLVSLLGIAAPASACAHRAPAPVVHHQHKVHHASRVSQTSPSKQYVPASQPPVAQHSPVGIAAGAVIGGILGNQVGGGNGRTLATVGGAVGGGYLGDVVGKKNGF